MNLKAIQGMAIVTALYQRDWAPDTDITEVLGDIEGIIAQANNNLGWAEVQSPSITLADVKKAVWGID